MRTLVIYLFILFYLDFGWCQVRAEPQLFQFQVPRDWQFDNQIPWVTKTWRRADPFQSTIVINLIEAPAPLELKSLITRKVQADLEQIQNRALSRLGIRDWRILDLTLTPLPNDKAALKIKARTTYRGPLNKVFVSLEHFYFLQNKIYHISYTKTDFRKADHVEAIRILSQFKVPAPRPQRRGIASIESQTPEVVVSSKNPSDPVGLTSSENPICDGIDFRYLKSQQSERQFAWSDPTQAPKLPAWANRLGDWGEGCKTGIEKGSLNALRAFIGIDYVLQNLRTLNELRLQIINELKTQSPLDNAKKLFSGAWVAATLAVKSNPKNLSIKKAKEKILEFEKAIIKIVDLEHDKFFECLNPEGQSKYVCTIYGYLTTTFVLTALMTSLKSPWDEADFRKEVTSVKATAKGPLLKAAKTLTEGERKSLRDATAEMLKIYRANGSREANENLSHIWRQLKDLEELTPILKKNGLDIDYAKFLVVSTDIGKYPEVAAQFATQFASPAEKQFHHVYFSMAKVKELLKDKIPDDLIKKILADLVDHNGPVVPGSFQWEMAIKYGLINEKPSNSIYARLIQLLDRRDQADFGLPKIAKELRDQGMTFPKVAAKIESIHEMTLPQLEYLQTGFILNGEKDFVELVNRYLNEFHKVSKAVRTIQVTNNLVMVGGVPVDDLDALFKELFKNLKP